MRTLGLVLALMSVTACPGQPPPSGPSGPTTPEPPPEEPTPTPVAGSFTNPLRASLSGGGAVENCAEPDIIRGRGSDTAWYVLCSPGPLNAQEHAGGGRPHLIPILKSEDLVQWQYVGDALASLPDWANPDSGLRGPDIVYANDRYYLYFTVLNTRVGGSAIGVATSASPVGPWTVAAAPAVEPHENPCCGNSRRENFDPEVLITQSGERYIYYGGYYGGISVRRLSEDGLTSDPYSQVEVTLPNRYQAAHVLRHGEYYYLLASAGGCCQGALSGYGVFAGRSRQPQGPFVDREGVRLTYNRVGGTPVLGANGNRWVGPGHSALVTDAGGQAWLLYQAIDRNDPFLSGSSQQASPSKRQLMMDALDWVEDWPVVRGALGPS
ncbi:MAG: family 43 glycosylhydrolase, partial [Cystobacter sp.]